MYDHIWFTYKARIRTQERLTQNDIHSQALLVWYAVLGTCIGIVTIRYPKFLGDNTDIVAAIFSVAILAVSMLVTNRDYRGRSLEMRRNYQALHQLYKNATLPNSAIPKEQIEKEYHVLIDSVENHASIDDKYFRFFHSGKLNSRMPTTSEKIEVVIFIVLRTALLTVLYLAPIAAFPLLA